MDQEKFKSILNNLGNTGIYVIEKDTHKILYFNDRVKEISPDISLGKVCHELWEGTCKNCPLNSIGDSDHNTTINYNDPFGDIVDITASKIIWDDIDAFLISVSKHSLTVEEKHIELEKNKLAAALSKVYSMVISVNLTRNTYSMIEYDNFDTKKAPEAGVFEDLIKIGASTMHPNFKDKFIKLFNRENILHSFENGNNEIYMEHKQLGDDGQYHWTNTHVIKINNPVNDDILELTLSKNIDEQKRAEEQLQNSFDTICKNSGGLNVKYLIKGDTIRLLDASKEYFNYFGTEITDYTENVFISKFSNLNQKYFEYVLNEASKKENISFEFPYPVNGEEKWFRVQAACIGYQNEGNVYFCTIMDITERKQEQLELNATYNSLPGGVAKIIIDDKFTLVDANKPFFEMIGCGKKEECYEKGYMDYIHEEDKNVVKDIISSQSLKGNSIFAEYRIKNKYDEIIWVRAEGKKVGIRNGKQVYLIVVLDITDRKLALKKLEEEEYRYKIAVESSADALFEYIFETDTLYTYESGNYSKNKKAYDFTINNYLSNIDKLGIVYHEDIEKVINVMNGNKSSDEVRLRIPNTKIYSWFMLQSNVIREKGKVIKVIGTLKDINRIKENDESRNRLQNICNFISNKDFELIFTVDLKSGRYNKAYYSTQSPSIFDTMDGEYYDKIMDIFVQNNIYKADLEKAKRDLDLENIVGNLNKEKKEYNIIFRLVNKNNEVRWKSVTFSYFDDDRATLLSAARDIQDIQELKMKEEIVDIGFNSAMDKIYEEIIYINLTKKRYEFIRSNNKLKIKREIGPILYDEKVMTSVHSLDRDEFNKIISIDSIINSFKKGKSLCSVESRRLGIEDKYHWTLTCAVRMDNNQDGDMMGLILVSNIDDRKMVEQSSEEMSVGISTLFEECITVNLTKNSYKAKKMDAEKGGIPENGAFDENNKLYCKSVIHPDDRKMFNKYFSLEALRNNLTIENKQVTKEMRRLLPDGKYHWCELSAVLLDNIIDEDKKALVIYRDIDNLKKAKEETKKANELFGISATRLYDRVFEGDLYSDTMKIWESIDNNITCRCSEYSLTENFEWIAENVIHPNQREEYLKVSNIDYLRDSFDMGKKEVYIEALRKDEHGLYKWCQMTAQPISKDKEHYRVMFYVKDFDDVKKEEERKKAALKDALTLAEQANSAKTDFLSRMSHDIRTPMNGIIGMTAIASSNIENKEKVSDCLSKINISAKFLLSLINDILDMSKIESGKININLSEFNFEEFINNISTIAYSQAMEKKQMLSINISKHIEKTYIGDSLRLNQILMNLLSNALKYTPEGGSISLNAEVDDIDEDNANICFIVRDNGIGMSKGFISKIYEPFIQENSNEGRIFEGSGLGLAITKNLVHLMNGKISVKSELNKGSEFSVVIPLKRTNLNKNSVYDKPQFRLNALIIDDDLVSLKKTVSVLNDMGIKTVTYNLGFKDIDNIKSIIDKEEDLDIIFISWGISEFDELKTIRKLKNIIGENTRVIFISSYVTSKVEHGLNKEGVDYVLSKSSFKSKVKDVLAEIVRNKEKSKINNIMFNGEYILLVEDNEINMEIAKTLLEMKGLNIDVACNGLEAVNKFKASDIDYYSAILMDIRMPVMDGLEATKRIRNIKDRKDSKEIPIIAMTANAFVEEKDTAKQIGMNEYLTKPIETDILYKTLKENISKN